MAGRKPPGNPVQVIKLVPDHSKGDSVRSLKLQTQVFRDIISNSGNYSVAVVAIAGAARGGKSFILTYLLRYLQALEKSPNGDAGDWMDRENPTTSMKGKGFDFRNGIDRTTDGIWMWSRPFIIKRASSPEPIAVIVIDTEGCFDACSTEREQSAIVGLALLASSCFIFNESTKINENTLLTLAKFMQYGQLASQSFQGKAFQRLMFLVRDWNMPNSFGFGAAGGKGFMEKCFQTSNPNMTKEAVKCREMIRNNFEDYDAYLMPHPGDDVISDEFKGSVGEMKENFREHVEKFIVNLVEDVSPKKIGQTLVGGKSYYDLLCKYVDEFNSPELPDPASIIQATMLVALEAETSKHVRNYKEAFEQKLSTEPGPFLGQEALEKIHKSIKKKQMQNYNSKLGSEQERQAFRQKAEQGMDACFLQVCQQNASKQEEFITASEAETLQKFRNYIATNVTSVKQYWKFEEFNEVVSRAEKRAEAKFLKVTQSSPESFLQNQLPLFLQKLNDIRMSCWRELESVRRSADEEVEVIIEEIVSDYYENLSLSIADNIVTENTLQRLNARHQDVAHTKFDRKVHKKFNDEEIIHEFKTLFSTKLKQKCEELAKDNKEKLEEYLSQITEDIRDAADILREDVEKLVPHTRSSDFSTLDTVHQEVYKAALEGLEDLKLLDRNLYAQYEQQLKTALDAVLLEAKQLVQLSAATKQEQCQGLVNSRVQELSNQLLSLMQESQDPFEDDLLLRKVNSVQTTIQKSLSDSLKEKDPGSTQQFLSQFENMAAAEMKKVDQQNFERKKRFENSAADKVRALKQEYGDKIKAQEQTCRSSTDLLRIHQTLSSELMQRLGQETLQKPSKLIIPWEESLKSDLEKIFDKTKAALEIKLDQRKNLQENAIRDALASFEEQGKNFLQKNPTVKKAEIEAKLDELAEDVIHDVQRLVNTAYEADSKEKKKIMGNFQEEIEDLKYELKVFAKNSQRKYVNGLETIVDECITFAEKQIQHTAESVALSNVGNLQEDFDDIENLTKATFESLWSFGNQNQLKDSTWDQILQKIDPRIKQAYAKLSSKLDKERKQLICLMDQVLLQSSTSLEEQLSGGKFHSVSKLEDATAMMKSNAEKNYRQQVEAVNPPNTQDLLDQFKRTVEMKIEDLRRRNIDNLEAVREGAKCKIEAHLDANKSSVKRKSELDDLVKAAEGKGKEYLKEKSIDDVGNHTELLEAIEKFTETLHIEVTKELSAGQIESEVLEEASKTYNEYMKENVERKNISVKLLADHHKLAVETSINKVSKRFFLSTEMETKIEKRLRLSLKIYDNKITLGAGQNVGDIAVGIDLGTTTCCVAVYKKGKAQVIKNKFGLSLTPSYVNFPSEGEPVIGTPAKDQAHLNPEQTVFDSKRLIGRTFSDPHIQKDIKTWPFEVRAGKGDRPEIVVNDKTYSPEDISSLLLSHMRNVAMESLGHEVKKAVITVPANFDDRQRDATRQAAQIAGLEVLQIINEPTAAAMAYAVNWKDMNRKVLVFDFGGGTFDVTILDAIGADLKVLTTLGDTHLGGEDFDSNMVHFCAKKFEEDNSIKLLEVNPDVVEHGEEAVRKRVQRLRARCEVTKQYLTTAPKAAIDVPAIYGEKDLHVKITRDEFERINKDLFQKAIQIVQQAITKAKLRKEDIKEVLMVGGSSRIPRIQQMLKEFLGHKSLIVNQEVDIQEAVALGASIQACILNGGSSAMNLIKDVQPYSLGINTVTGNMSVIIPKDSPIPFEKFQTYTTTEDNQEEVNIEIFSGEDPIALNNKSLGSFVLGGIPPGVARTQDIEVKMQIDSSGILSVTAVCLSNGASKNLVIQENRGRLSEEEVKERRKALELAPPSFFKRIFTG